MAAEVKTCDVNVDLIRKRLDSLESEVGRLRELKGLPGQLTELAKTVKDGLDSLSAKFDKMNDPEIIRKDEQYRSKVLQLEHEIERFEKKLDNIEKETDANTKSTNRQKTIGSVLFALIGIIIGVFQALQFFK